MSYDKKALDETFPPEESSNSDGWREVSGGGGDTWDFNKNNTIIGCYTGKRDNVGPNNSTMYNIEVVGDGVRSVWGSTALDMDMENVAIGQQVKIVYRGMKKNPKSGREFKDFGVYVK